MKLQCRKETVSGDELFFDEPHLFHRWKAKYRGCRGLAQTWVCKRCGASVDWAGLRRSHGMMTTHAVGPEPIWYEAPHTDRVVLIDAEYGL